MSGKVFKGMDYQGRHPEAAHAATGEGEDYSEPDGSGVIWGVLYGLLAWLAMAMCVVTVWGVQ